METYAIISKSLEQQIAVFEAEKEDMWQKKLEALRFYVEHIDTDVKVESHLLATTPSTVAVICTISGYNRSIQRVGEVELTETNPVTKASELAFVQAAIDFYLLRLHHKKSSSSTTTGTKNAAEQKRKTPSDKNAQEAIEPIRDTDIILFGNLSGQRYGDVRNTEQFQKFLDNLSKIEGMVFPEEAKNKQFRQLLALAGGGS